MLTTQLTVNVKIKILFGGLIKGLTHIVNCKSGRYIFTKSKRYRDTHKPQ